MKDVPTPKPLFWMGSSRRDRKQFFPDLRQIIGFALWEAQNGGKHPDAKPLKGFSGAGVLELVEDQQGSTYRAVYTVKFGGAVYALHAFQKKSKRGSKTSLADRELIRSRLKLAEKHYEQWCKSEEQTKNRR